MVCARGTLFDVYIICQGSDFRKHEDDGNRNLRKLRI